MRKYRKEQNSCRTKQNPFKTTALTPPESRNGYQNLSTILQASEYTRVSLGRFGKVIVH